MRERLNKRVYVWLAGIWQNQFNYLSHCGASFTSTEFTLPFFRWSERNLEKKSCAHSTEAKKCWMYENSAVSLSTCILTNFLRYIYRLPFSTNDSCGLLHVLTSSSWCHHEYRLVLLPSHTNFPFSFSSCHSFSFMYMNMNDMFSMLHFFYDNSFLWCFIILTLSYHKVIHGRRLSMLSISGWLHDVRREKTRVERGTKNRYLIEKLFSRRCCGNLLGWSLLSNYG